MFLCQALMHKQGKMSMKNKIKFKKDPGEKPY